MIGAPSGTSAISSTKITPKALEPVHHQLVVDDLVVAVDGRLEGPDHPGQGLDGHLDAGAEAPGRGQQHPVDIHVIEATDEPIGTLARAMSLPRVVAVAPGSPADRAGIEAGDEVLQLNGEVPRDILRWRWLTDEPEVEVELRRGGLEKTVTVEKAAGEPLGAEVASALFDQVRTCDNHCEFCFIYQLPPGLRRSLYLKDDDYRLSFLYGNFTTLTRFTESDLERVIDEGLSPLNVSIHATDPDVRSRMLRNRRGATSLRWLRALLDHGVTVHGQVVVCPGVNDGAVLEDTLTGVLDQYPELATLCVVPLGVSRFNREAAMRPHTTAEAAAVVDTVARMAGLLPRPCSAGGWCSLRTSTTCWPVGRSRTPRPTRASRCTRTAWAWPARSSSSSRAASRRRRACRAGSSLGWTVLRAPGTARPGTPRDRPACGWRGRRARVDRPSRCCRPGGHRSGC